MDERNVDQHLDKQTTPISRVLFPTTVLIVDDNRENLRLLSNILSRHGYTVRAALNGERAIASIQTSHPDIILLDIMMPDMNGYDVCTILKGNEHTNDIPIIFISALNEAFDKVKAFSIGAVDYITKPFQMEEVLVRIETRLIIQRTNVALKHANAELIQTVDELDRRNLEMSLLNRMSTALQRSETFAKAIEVSIPFLQQLFADVNGALYLSNTTNGALECLVHWGTVEPEIFIIPMELCATNSTSLSFPSMWRDQEKDADHPLLNGWHCIRLLSRGELLGMLCLQSPVGRTDAFLDHWLRLSIMVTDHLSLALANLQLRERLHRQSIRDPLTGLYNRRYLDETLPKELEQSLEKLSSVGVILLDIDHFKRFNDTHGHDGGDALLQAVGSILTSQSRSKDIACRYGGEEFVLILPGATLEMTYERAEQFRGNIEQLRVWHNGMMLDRVTASFGVAAFPLSGSTDEEVIKASDQALYRAKKEGRNRVICAETTI
jgi:diguanylate cyclase (GGDEF)-like protein